MAVSSGFFNSINHDRLYDAEQFSSIFDGIILDGVYENFGEAFKVTAYPDSDNTVIVGTGRAWFDHTWTYNDSQFSIELDPPNEMLGRVDMIVIDVNRETGVRANTIKLIRGTEANPNEPIALIKTELHNQYPIAYIKVPAGSSAPISQANIVNKVGSDECPVVASLLEAMNLANMWSQLDAEFREWWEEVRSSLDESGILELVHRLDEIEQDLASLTSKLPLTKPELDFSLVTVRSNTVFLPDGKYVYFDYSDSGFYLFNADGVQSSKTTSSAPAGSNRWEKDFVTINAASYPCMFMVVWSIRSVSDYTRTFSVAYETITVTEEGTVSKSQSNVTYVPGVYMRYDNYANTGAAVKSYTTTNGDVYIPYIFGNIGYGSGSSDFDSKCSITLAKYGSDGVRQATMGTLEPYNYTNSPYFLTCFGDHLYYNRTYADPFERYLYIDGYFQYSNGTSRHAGYLLGGTFGLNDAIYSSFIPIRISNFSLINNLSDSSPEYSDFPRSPDDLKLPAGSGSSSGHELTWNDLETYTRDGTKHKIELKQYDNAVRASVPYGYTDILPYSDDIAICKTGVSNVIGLIYKGFRYYFSGDESSISITSTSTTLDDKIKTQDGSTLLYCFDAIPKIEFTNTSSWFIKANSNGTSFYIYTNRSSTDSDANSGLVIYLKEV